MTRLIILSFAILLLLQGCSSIVSGGSQQISIVSEPSGARVRVNGANVGTTPLKTDVKRRDGSMTVTVEKEGYKSHTQSASSKINGWFWGNILIGGLLGSTTDSLTGSMYEYAPGDFFVRLNPSDPSGQASSKSSLSEQESSRIITFVYGSYKRLASELSTKPGEHVDALLEMLKIPPDQHQDVIGKMRQFMSSSPTAIDFANNVSTLYNAAAREAKPPQAVISQQETK